MKLMTNNKTNKDDDSNTSSNTLEAASEALMHDFIEGTDINTIAIGEDIDDTFEDEYSSRNSGENNKNATTIYEQYIKQREQNISILDKMFSSIIGNQPS